MIELRNVSKTYRRGIVGLKDVTLHIKEGEFVYVIGQSGSGKSTLLKLLYRDEPATSGSVKVCNRQVNRMKNGELYKLRREIGVVFQDYKLLQNRTVYENVAYCLDVIGLPQEEMDAKVRRALNLVELGDKGQRMPHELSGGEQQRVAIARSIVNSPKLIIADEPTGNLDPRTSMEIFRILYRINRQGVTVVMATHDYALVEKFRFRIITMEKGRIVQDVLPHQRNTLLYDEQEKDYFIV